MPKRIILVASTTGYQTRMFSEAAARAGVELVLATDRCHVLEDPWGDRAIPVKFDRPEDVASQILEQAAAWMASSLSATGPRLWPPSLPPGWD